MKIAFDYQAFSMQAFGGISRYFARLSNALDELGDEPKIFSPFHKNIYLDSLPIKSVSGLRMRRFPFGTKNLIKHMNPALSRHQIKKWKPDIIHATYYDGGATASSGAPYIVTVHDMIHEKFTKDFRKRDNTTEMKRASVCRADHVVCISENTKNDLIEIFGVDPEKLTVVHHGADGPEIAPGSKCRIAPPGKPYLLYVGVRKGYKNFNGLLEAVARSKKLKRDFDIYSFGCKPFSKEEGAKIKSLGFGAGQVAWVAGDDRVLRELYRNAAAFVYPSLYEGFGLPPLEAMSCGCAVVCSNTSSMPEVVGDAGAYFDPTSLESISDAIERVVYSSDVMDGLIQKGRKRVQEFTWKRCAEETRDVYRKIAA
jgi:glycosyltransferase involved in cell wall biosynthesis